MEILPADLLEKNLATTISNSSQDVLLLLSGGSQLHKISKIITEMKQQDVRFSKVTVSAVDERYDSNPKHENSNIVQFYNIPEFSSLPAMGATIMEILSEGLSLEDTGQRISSMISECCNDDNRLNIAVVGIGVDGHIAGIIPHHPKHTSMFYGEAIVGYDADQVKASSNDFRERVTLTFEGFSRVDKVLIYAIGERKRATLQRLVDQKGIPSQAEIAHFPALYLSTLEDVTLYTDLTLAGR